MAHPFDVSYFENRVDLLCEEIALMLFPCFFPSRKKRRRSYIIPLELRRSSAYSRRNSNSGFKYDR